MSILKKSIIASSLVLTVSLIAQLPTTAAPVSDSQAPEGSLKLVMQGLLSNTQQLTEAVLTEDFVRIENIAKNIAEHPKPSMATRMKLMKALGAEMAKFKANDDVVHNAAVDMIGNAQSKDIKAVGKNFQTMISGCLSCHGEFKSKVSAILK